MSLTLVASPSDEPVAIDDAKQHLRVTDDEQDNVIAGLIMVARQYAEAYTGRALVTQTWDWTIDAFETCLHVPLPPLVSVTNIKYNDAAGAEQTLSTSIYSVDTKSQPGRIVQAYAQTWPVTRGHINDVTIRFVAGYGEGAAVPQQIKQAMLLLIGELYERREHAVVGAIISDVPFGVTALLDSYRSHYRVSNI